VDTLDYIAGVCLPPWTLWLNVSVVYPLWRIAKCRRRDNVGFPVLMDENLDVNGAGSTVAFRTRP
jgi:hypothetical protein